MLPLALKVASIAVAAPVGFLIVAPATTLVLGAIGFSSTGVVAGKQNVWCHISQAKVTHRQSQVPLPRECRARSGALSPPDRRSL